MTNLDDDLDLVKRLIDAALEKIAYLEPAMRPGWILYAIQGLEAMCPGPGGFDAMLADLLGAIENRRERGYWQ
jgi:hypothetical protein